jgi:hypothetical protein
MAKRKKKVSGIKKLLKLGGKSSGKMGRMQSLFIVGGGSSSKKKGKGRWY